MTRLTIITIFLVSLLLAGCTGTLPREHDAAGSAAGTSASLLALEQRLREVLPGAASDTLEVSIAVRDLATGDSLLIDGHTVMHAASTMKVPVMLELFRRVEAGEISLHQPITVSTSFRSIADGSSYSLSASQDSDTALYQYEGQTRPLLELMERMIVRSSNLATNLLIDLADPARIAATMRELGASGVSVLRGVEDTPAFERGMNNTTTAHGMMRVLEAIAAGRVTSPSSTAEMIRILEAQEFQETIPAGLPPGTRVGNKTGWITGINHDAAIIMPEGRAPYVLVVFTRGYRNRAAAQAVGRAVSDEVYRTLVGRR
ncbi:MAG: serine hydrolase [Gemmatimonadetes bacterium]|nr:serine hydrolase [Gemmatimonadota bacterium]